MCVTSPKALDEGQYFESIRMGHLSRGTYLVYVHGVLQEADAKYPGFFALHSALFNGLSKEEGRKQRDSNFTHLKKQMIQVLFVDQAVRPEALAKLDREEFVNVLLVSILYSQLSHIDSDKVLLTLVKSTLY